MSDHKTGQGDQYCKTWNARLADQVIYMHKEEKRPRMYYDKKVREILTEFLLCPGLEQPARQFQLYFDAKQMVVYSRSRDEHTFSMRAMEQAGPAPDIESFEFEPEDMTLIKIDWDLHGKRMAKPTMTSIDEASVDNSSELE